MICSDESLQETPGIQETTEITVMREGTEMTEAIRPIAIEDTLRPRHALRLRGTGIVVLSR